MTQEQFEILIQDLQEIRALLAAFIMGLTRPEGRADALA